MPRQAPTKNSDHPAEEVLGAMLDALIESKSRDKFLTNDEFYALTCAFAKAKRYISSAERSSFAMKVLKILNWDDIRNEELEYGETYELFMDHLTS